ncbi:uncharacterized protein LOC110885823 [Helianthus annuus]|uniref:uncharacterized protein LOC110885823 n=1 Tax=Helianthus annuus TaxID=4232 RepID=UPI0016533CBC|nr:uncharacterized protein LOC110885823 [Helianthus annuus]XP_035837424.1 uncharacterized protein LOC110885823 [Helianthus annuus]
METSFVMTKFLIEFTVHILFGSFSRQKWRKKVGSLRKWKSQHEIHVQLWTVMMIRGTLLLLRKWLLILNVFVMGEVVKIYLSKGRRIPVCIKAKMSTSAEKGSPSPLKQVHPD